MQIEDSRIGGWGLGDLRVCDCRFKAALLVLRLRGSHSVHPAEIGADFAGAADADSGQARTQKFAKSVIEFCQRLPNDTATQKIVSQLLDSAGSTDSNYRATCRARSPDEFIARIDARELIQESDELTAIFVASRKTAQRRKAERERLQKQLREGIRRRPSK